MNLAAHLRVGSLEILIALAVFGAIVRGWRAGVPAVRRHPRTVRLQLKVHDSPGVVGAARDVAVTLGDGLPAAVIGRSSAAQVGLLDPEVSRRHAQLDLTRGVVYLSDLGSANGTFLNGNRLKNEGIEVRPGDDIDVGTTRITVIEMA